jgi:tetratricopeptide (TPR) repeat protein
MSGYTCVIAGKHEEGIEHFRRAMQLDPMDPWAFNAYLGIAFPNFFMGRYEEALEWVDKALLEQPSRVNALLLKIAASAMAGRPPKQIQMAIGLLRKAEPEISVASVVLRMPTYRPADRELYVEALRLAGMS